jgi:hypothetical protein
MLYILSNFHHDIMNNIIFFNEGHNNKIFHTLNIDLENLE